MGVHERPQPHAGSKYQGMSPLFPGICSWDPSILGHVQGRKEDQASIVESGSPSLCGPRPFSHTLGAKTFKCIGESPGLTMTKNASQEYSIPSLWVERQRHSKGHLGLSVQITRSLLSLTQCIHPIQKVPEIWAMSDAPVYIFGDHI